MSDRSTDRAENFRILDDEELDVEQVPTLDEFDPDLRRAPVSNENFRIIEGEELDGEQIPTFDEFDIDLSELRRERVETPAYPRAIRRDDPQSPG